MVANGGSYTATRSTPMPAPAARRASAPPEDTPNRVAEPPAAATSAARSSISRSVAYWSPAPLSPRPRRSKLNTRHPWAASCSAMPADGPNARWQSAPSTITTAGPSPAAW